MYPGLSYQDPIELRELYNRFARLPNPSNDEGRSAHYSHPSEMQALQGVLRWDVRYTAGIARLIWD